MIKNALAHAASHADLWSELKSIDHTLNRILNDARDAQLTEFDRERLKALAKFLRETVLQSPQGTPLSAQSLLHATRLVPFASFDFRATIRMVEGFKNYQAASKTSFEKKVQTLIEAIESFVGKSAQEFFPKHAALPEFAILRDVVKNLLSAIEPAILWTSAR